LRVPFEFSVSKCHLLICWYVTVRFAFQVMFTFSWVSLQQQLGHTGTSSRCGRHVVKVRAESASALTSSEPPLQLVCLDQSLASYSINLSKPKLL
jgi:hypothetical protein